MLHHTLINSKIVSYVGIYIHISQNIELYDQNSNELMNGLTKKYYLILSFQYTISRL